jgi:iron complex transport system substrate-binding protein
MLSRLLSNSYLFYILFIHFSCSSSVQQKESIKDAESIKIKYAKGFSISYEDGYKIITVNQAWKNASQPIHYILLSEGQALPQSSKGKTVIRTPIKKVVCLSTTHTPFMDLLGESSKIIGLSGSQYISSPNIRQLIKEGKIKEVGKENGINLELILDLDVDLVIGYAMNQSDNNYLQMTRTALPLVLNSEYLEESPLGKAEWIKFVAAFFDKEQDADSIFNGIEKEYLYTSQLAQQQVNRPSVFANIPYGGTWYVAGGRSFGAKYIQDAGGEYIFAKDTSQGSVPMNIEVVFQMAHKADFWINVSDFRTLEELRSVDNRFTEFEAFKQGNIFNNNHKVNENGGIEYWELGVARPDIVLKDLAKIFHPQLFPDKELYFYQQLK